MKIYENVLNHCKPWDFGVPMGTPFQTKSHGTWTQEHISALWYIYRSGHMLLAACLHMNGRCKSLKHRAKSKEEYPRWCGWKLLLSSILVVVLCCNNVIYLEQFEQVCMLLHSHRSVRLFLLVVLEIGTDWIKFCLIAKFSEMQTKTFEAGGQI